jgi:hypothetical protein
MNEPQVIDTKYRLQNDPYFRCFFDTVKNSVKGGLISLREMREIMDLLEKDIERDFFSIKRRGEEREKHFLRLKNEYI